MKRAKLVSLVVILWTCSSVTEGDSSTTNIVQEKYFEMEPFEGSYSFGYDISPNGHFHHENRARDGVTYGCYGHVDPEGRLHATTTTTHYLADSRGYRVVKPGRPAIIFTKSANSRRARKEVREWQDLLMPEGCGFMKGSTQSDILGGVLGGIPPVVGTITDTVTGLVNGTVGGLAGVATTPAIPPISVTTPVSTGTNATVANNSTSVASSASSG